MEDWELVDEYFCRVCELSESDLDASSKSLVEVYHSFGIIQNGGMHGYLCEVGDQTLVVTQHYETVGLSDCARSLTLAHGLWRKYWPDGDPDDSDPDDFRDRFSSALDALEDDFYDQEDEMIARLVEVVRNQTNHGEQGVKGNEQAPWFASLRMLDTAAPPL